jgi:hypothetical protein
MTRSDSTPASLLEAMASGLPAVCARATSSTSGSTTVKAGYSYRRETSKR